MRNEPPHIHVIKGGGQGKIWLNPELKQKYFVGFKMQEVKEIMSIATDNYSLMLNKWYEHFRK